MSVMLRLKMAVHFRSFQLSSHLFIYLSLGQLCVILDTVLQIKCLETTTYNTFMNLMYIGPCIIVIVEE